MNNEIKRMTQEVTEQQRKLGELFEKLEKTQGLAAQKKVMFEIYQVLLDRNSKLFDENIALRTRLKSITVN